MTGNVFTKRQKRYLAVKRFLDVILSFLAIIVLFPFFIIVGLLVKITSRGPILFRQKRIGRNKKVFRIFKFRTMRVDAPEIPPSNMTKEQQKAMLTKIGAFLRKTSIDELPQVLNIFVGHMSIIGPRPAAAKNEDDIIEERDKYEPSPNLLRPGLSGYAQTHGRKHETKQKAEFDAFYAINISFSLDVKIFFLTIKKLFFFEGS
ncbi:MAG: sugar transferase [Methanomicrobia archaeon]|nr:sugar transferase [Methanomicrobia archaeon]